MLHDSHKEYGYGPYVVFENNFDGLLEPFLEDLYARHKMDCARSTVSVKTIRSRMRPTKHYSPSSKATSFCRTLTISATRVEGQNAFFRNGGCGMLSKCALMACFKTAGRVQQLREAFPFEASRKYLIFDRDRRFGFEVHRSDSEGCTIVTIERHSSDRLSAGPLYMRAPCAPGSPS